MGYYTTVSYVLGHTESSLCGFKVIFVANNKKQLILCLMYLQHQ